MKQENALSSAWCRVHMKAQGSNHGFGRKFLDSEDRVRKQFLLHKETGELGMYNVGGGHNGPPVLTNPGDVPVFFFVSGNISKPGTSNIFSNNKRNRKRRMIAIDE